MNDMLPCPFCGGEAHLRTDGITVIACDACDIYFSNGHRYMGGLIAAWNKRANVEEERT